MRKRKRTRVGMRHGVREKQKGRKGRKREGEREKEDVWLTEKGKRD
jgi:hypothetical protein